MLPLPRVFLAVVGLGAAHGLCLAALSKGCSLLRGVGFSLWWFLSLRSVGSGHPGFRAVARGLSSRGVGA